MTNETNGRANGEALPAHGAYRRLVLVDRNRHAALRVRPVQDWSFLHEVNAVALTMAEFAEAAREFPIGFVRSGTDEAGKPRIVPTALLGLQERSNLFVARDGRWEARCLPASLRRYPFAYVRTGPEQLSLAVDEAYAGLGEGSGGDGSEALFGADHEPSDYLRSVMRFLDRFEAEQQRTEALCQRLVALDLLRGAEINGELADGQKISASGFYMVDEDKLAKLHDVEVLALHRSGALAALHAHLIAMGQVQALAQRMMAR